VRTMAVRALKISKYLGRELYGKDRDVIKPCSLDNCCDGGLVFLKKYDERMLSILSGWQNITAIVTLEYHGKLSCSYVISGNPRLDFARVLQEFFVPKVLSGISETARIGRNVSLGKDVTMGDYSIIGNDVVIGDGTEIRHHVVIGDNTIIGRGCLIKSNTVIGEEGFGFERDEKGVPIRIPHLGKVIIGNNVEIGALNTVMRGTLDDTIVADNVKTDDHVHIGHNVRVGQGCLITACVEISGSAHIGEMTWLGPNCSVMNGITIGDNCLIGLGTVVTKSLPDNVVVAGCPAKILRKNA
jgi:UDP-3-O-[3-hydroxymyristoyl] glucosamine N-acyltransferase